MSRITELLQEAEDTLARQGALRELWDLLDTPIVPVLDEDGVQMEGGQMRRLTDGHWLYVDDKDGYQILEPQYGERLAR